MAVSYVSKVFQSSPYILPVDVNLLNRVNSYKQNQFYKNAAATQSELSQIANSDILNPQQAQLLKARYDNITNQIQQNVGIDYSDPNVVNQLRSMAGEIVNDPNILSGIASTRKIRSLQAGWDKITTTKGMEKYYNPANRSWDERSIGDYVNGGVSATYNGPSTPTLYAGNVFDKVTERVKELKPNLQVGYNPVTGERYFYDKVTQQVLSTDRVNALMNGVLQNDPALQQQMTINAWYGGRGQTAEDVKSDWKRYYDGDISNLKNNINKITQALTTAATNGEKENLQSQLAAYEAQLKELQGLDVSKIDQMLNTEDGRINVQTQLLRRRLFEDAATAFSYTEIKDELQFNRAAFEEDKMSLQERIAAAKLAAAGGRGTGAGRGTGTRGGGGTLGPNGEPLEGTGFNTETEAQVESQELSGQKVKDLIANTRAESSNILRSYLIDNANLDALQQSRSNFEQLIDNNIANLDGRPGLSIDDLRKAASDAKMAAAAKTYFGNVVRILDQGAQGAIIDRRDVTFNINDAIATAKKLAHNESIAQAWENQYNQARNVSRGELYSKYKLSPQEIELVEKYVNNPSAYNSVKKGRLADVDSNDALGVANKFISDIFNQSGEQTEFTGGNLPQAQKDQLRSVLRKIGIVAPLTNKVNLSDLEDFDKVSQQALDKINFRETFPVRYIGMSADNLKKANGDIQAALKDKAVNTEGQALGDVEHDTISIDKIEAISRSDPNYAPSGGNKRYKVTFTYKDGPKVKTAINYIDDRTARRFQIQSDQEADLNNALIVNRQLNPQYVRVKGVNFQGQSSDNLTPQQIVAGFGFGSDLFKYQIVRPDGANGNVYIDIFDDKNNKIRLKRGVRNGNDLYNFTSASQAESYIETILSNIALTGTKSRGEVFDGLRILAQEY